jgi:hypothetical protein
MVEAALWGLLAASSLLLGAAAGYFLQVKTGFSAVDAVSCG